MCIYIQWWHQKFCLEGSLKNFNKKKLEYIELLTKKKKKNLIHVVLQFYSTSFQILNGSLRVSIINVDSYEPMTILFC